MARKKFNYAAENKPVYSRQNSVSLITGRNEGFESKQSIAPRDSFQTGPRRDIFAHQFISPALPETKQYDGIIP